MVFRPSHYDFPPSRGRQSIQLKKGIRIIFSDQVKTTEIFKQQNFMNWKIPIF